VAAGLVRAQIRSFAHVLMAQRDYLQTGFGRTATDKDPPRMGTLTGYAIAVVFVLAALNGIAWLTGYPPQLRSLNVFSAGFILGMLGMYIAAWLYGYHK
jgi:hypothetical protein